MPKTDPQSVPTSDAKPIWDELQAALNHVSNAEFELSHGDVEDALVWLGDARRALGAAALALADFAGYARLAEQILTPPRTPGEIKHWRGQDARR